MEDSKSRPTERPTEPDEVAKTYDSHTDQEQPEKSLPSPKAEDSSAVLTGAPFVLLVFSLVLSSWLVALNATVIGTVRSSDPLLGVLTWCSTADYSSWHRQSQQSPMRLAASTT